MKQQITLQEINQLTPTQLKLFQKRWVPRPGDVIYLMSKDRLGIIFSDIQDKDGRHLSVYWHELGYPSTIFLSDDIVCLPSIGVMMDYLLKEQMRRADESGGSNVSPSFNLDVREDLVMELWELVKESLNEG